MSFYVGLHPLVWHHGVHVHNGAHKTTEDTAFGGMREPQHRKLPCINHEVLCTLFKFNENWVTITHINHKTLSLENLVKFVVYHDTYNIGLAWQFRNGIRCISCYILMSHDTIATPRENDSPNKVRWHEFMASIKNTTHDTKNTTRQLSVCSHGNIHM